MTDREQFDFINLFRLPSLSVICLIVVIVLSLLGKWDAVGGLCIGAALFVAKSFFLYEWGRSLLGGQSRGRARALATLASVGRLLFLGVSLAFVSRWGTVPLFAACGGLLGGQLNLHLTHLITGRIRRCSNI